MVPQAVKFTETESRTVVTQGWGDGDGELYSGYRLSVLQQKEFCRLMVKQSKSITHCCTFQCEDDVTELLTYKLLMGKF